MNPIVHAELSWLSAQGLRSRKDRALVVLAGLLPDLDGLTLLAGEDAYGEYHHLLTHGLLAAVAGCGLLAAWAHARLKVFALGLCAFHLHLGCDLLGSGPGWPIYYFWPLSRAEWYWAGQWNLASWQNSVIGMTATGVCLAFALLRGRTPVELLSLAADAKVVHTLRVRFLPGDRASNGPSSGSPEKPG